MNTKKLRMVYWFIKGNNNKLQLFLKAGCDEVVIQEDDAATE
ncbi:MAG: hypothetical protein Q8742_02105 [Candidatus Phytoplasma australasiaticum]|nr:hypothetical protein [Candidatus Phytoplasma australasiaticum]